MRKGSSMIETIGEVSGGEIHTENSVDYTCDQRETLTPEMCIRNNAWSYRAVGGVLDSIQKLLVSDREPAERCELIRSGPITGQTET